MPPTAPMLPFCVDRDAAVDLTDQITRGLDSAISAGVFQPGERLPGIRDMARELGVSNVVVSRAVRRLSGAGRLSARRRAGIRVAESDRHIWRGHVLLVDSPAVSYYFGMRAQAILDLLQAANLRVTVLAHRGEADEPLNQRVTAALDGMAVTLVLLTVTLPAVIAACETRGIPYVLVGKDVPAGARPVALVRQRSKSAMDELVAHIRGLNVRRIHAVTFHHDALQRFQAALATVGLQATAAQLTAWDERNGVEGYEYFGFKVTQQLLAQGDLPELIYAPDDYIARGCLTALLLAGKRVPLDLQLVCWQNRGAQIAYTGPMTRIEQDPDAHGRTIAGAVLAALDASDAAPDAPPPCFTVAPTFIAGSTTCPLPAPAY